MGARPRRRNSEVLAELLELEGARVLDLGCGDGALLRWLLRRGADAYGLDSQLSVLRRATEAVGSGRCIRGRAEALPFDDGCFDAAIFFNSLHHLPEGAMTRALEEARRVLRDGGRLAVVEPLAEGGYFEVMRPLEDETTVRAAARRAVREVAGEGFRPVGETEYETLVPVPSADALLARLAAADPRRAARLRSVRSEVERLFAAHRCRDAEGRPALEQPMRIDLLRRD